MVSVSPQPSTAAKPPVFAISCWVLALIAFVQLLVGALALSRKFEQSQQVRIVEKEVPKTVVIRVPAEKPAAAVPELSRVENPVVSRPPVPFPTETASLVPVVPPTPVSTPKIADPRTERLVKEARKARVLGDMGLAIMKLEEASTQSPEDPNVHYEMGLVHEQMGVFDVAGAHYEKVFQLGSSISGSLYELAAEKLRDGLDKPPEIGTLSLGRVRVFNDPQGEDGQKVILTIPVQKSPSEDIDVGEIAVSVLFFNRTSKGEIEPLPLENKSWVNEKWVTLPFDWVGGEEDLRMTYVIPPQDVQTEHLFGQRTYYGQVVTLRYKGEVVDVQAWPRELAARIPAQAQAPATNPDGVLQPEFQDTLPPDFDPNVPLLPPLPRK